MKVGTAIIRADEMRPNAIPETTKAAWLYRLEAENAETMGVAVPENRYPDHDDDLLFTAPRDEIYPLYLCAMIDYANEETSLYENDMIMANAAIQEARAWWNRTHLREEWHIIRTM